MDSVARLTSEAADAVTSAAPAGSAISLMCGAAFLSFGLAHYAGVAKQVATSWRFSPTVGLAPAWLGGGALIITTAGWLMSAQSAVCTVLGLLLALVGSLLWLVGIVAVFWLPQRLRPRWQRKPTEPSTGPFEP